MEKTVRVVHDELDESDEWLRDSRVQFTEVIPMPNEESTERDQTRQRVIIKFRDSVSGLPYDDTIDSYISTRFPAIFTSLRERFTGLRVTPLFDSVPAEEIRRFQQRAIDAGAKGVPNFLTYFAVWVPTEFAAEELEEHLRRSSTEDSEDCIECCYVEEAPGEDEETPGEDVGTTSFAAAHSPEALAGDFDPDVKSGLQRHLGAAPMSIDAHHAWTINGGDGTGVRFADIECGWVLNHIEFQGYNLRVLGDGVIDVAGPIHGTNVLGIVAGKKNGELGQGIAYGLESVLLASPCRAFGVFDVASALMEVVTQPKPPHVILFEVGAKKATLPIETEEGLLRQMISTATGPGHDIVVVEPAGNAPPHGEPVSIDTVIDDDDDSGAIIVGAVQPGLEPDDRHKRHDASNFGDRVDCYAWGDGIHTATTDGTSTMESGFGLGETSGASAIVAGVALSIQGMLKSAGRPLLSPKGLREILRNPELGTRCDPEGSMPDLKKIANHLKLPSA